MSTNGAMVVGIHVGLIEGRLEHLKTDMVNTTYFFHDPATFRKMRGQIGEETGTKWKNESRLKAWDEMEWDSKDTAYLGPNAKMIEFVVNRVD
jgi:hypothetical protein